VLGILHRYTPLVEQVSVDEACLDVTGSARLFGDAREIAVSIKKAVRDELGLTASIGVAANRLVAKIASDLEKPDGLVAVRPGAEAKFLAPLPVEKLPGVGPRTAEELRRLGVRILGELAAHPAEFLAARFGTLGPSLRTRALGEDATPVTDISKRGQAAQKSVSAEITLRDFTDDPEEVDRRLLELSEEVAARAREEGIECRTITLKLRDDRFATRTRAETLPRATNLTREVFETARGLYRASPVARGRKVRLLGVALSKFSACGAGQMELLVDGSREREKRVEKAVDDIRGKMGGDAVVRGLLMDRPRRGQET